MIEPVRPPATALTSDFGATAAPPELLGVEGDVLVTGTRETDTLLLLVGTGNAVDSVISALNLENCIPITPHVTDTYLHPIWQLFR